MIDTSKARIDSDQIISVRISKEAHADNWSMWESYMADASEFMERGLRNCHPDDLSVAIDAYRAYDSIDAGTRTVRIEMTARLASDLMDHHGYLGDMEAWIDERGLRFKHRRASLAIFKALRNAGFDVRNPVHWWTN